MSSFAFPRAFRCAHYTQFGDVVCPDHSTGTGNCATAHSQGGWLNKRLNPPEIREGRCYGMVTSRRRLRQAPTPCLLRSMKAWCSRLQKSSYRPRRSRNRYSHARRTDHEHRTARNGRLAIVVKRAIAIARRAIDEYRAARKAHEALRRLGVLVRLDAVTSRHQAERTVSQGHEAFIGALRIDCGTVFVMDGRPPASTSWTFASSDASTTICPDESSPEIM